jgi:hypothetical protein
MENRTMPAIVPPAVRKGNTFRGPTSQAALPDFVQFTGSRDKDVVSRL